MNEIMVKVYIIINLDKSRALKQRKVTSSWKLIFINPHSTEPEQAKSIQALFFFSIRSFFSPHLIPSAKPELNAKEKNNNNNKEERKKDEKKSWMKSGGRVSEWGVKMTRRRKWSKSSFKVHNHSKFRREWEANEANEQKWIFALAVSHFFVSFRR